MARVRAHIRRAQRDREPDDILTFADGDFVINIPARQVCCILGESVDLTPREFSLLHVLANNAGRVVTVSDLTEQAWGLEEDDPRRNALKPISITCAKSGAGSGCAALDCDGSWCRLSLCRRPAVADTQSIYDAT